MANSDKQRAVIICYVVCAIILPAVIGARARRQSLQNIRQSSHVNNHRSVTDARGDNMAYPGASNPEYNLENSFPDTPDVVQGDTLLENPHDVITLQYVEPKDDVLRNYENGDQQAIFVSSARSRSNQLSTLFLLNLLLNEANRYDINRRGLKDSSRLGNDDIGAFTGSGIVSKRTNVECDLTKVTINTIVEYLRTGKVCGFRAGHVRFGLGG